MKKALFVALKEIRSYLTDPGDLAFSLLLPVAIFALMYGAFGGGTQFNGTAYIVNQDASGQYSSTLLKTLGQYKGLAIQQLTEKDAENKLERSDVQLVVYIPAGFSENLSQTRPADLIFRQRGNGGLEGQIVANLVRGAAESIGQNIQIQSGVQLALAGSGISSTNITTTVQKFVQREDSAPIVTLSESNVGSSPDPVNQFLPGVMTMFVLFAINLTSRALVEERRKGTLERLLTTRLTVGQLFIGKFLANVGRAFVQTLILLLLAYAVFQVFTPFTFLEAMALALIFAAATSTIGLIIGSLSRSEDQATWIGVFFTMFMVMVSGTFVTVSPGTIFYTLSKISINTYANNAFRAVISGGGNLADVRFDIFVLIGVVVVGLVLSRFLFRATQRGK